MSCIVSALYYYEAPIITSNQYKLMNRCGTDWEGLGVVVGVAGRAWVWLASELWETVIVGVALTGNMWWVWLHVQLVSLLACLHDAVRDYLVH